MKTICMMRDLYKALAEFEAQFEKEYALSLNEAMILCALQEVKEEMTSTALSARTGMAASHIQSYQSSGREGIDKKSLRKDRQKANVFQPDPGRERTAERTQP